MPGINLVQVSPVFPVLHESLQLVLSSRLGWNELRDVQERSFTAIAAGRDVLVIAPTAGGKSEAALIPVMDDTLKNGRSGVTCLYISPQKALINDQEDRFRAFCEPTGLSVTKWHGDVPKGDRGWKEGEPPHFLMITPESLEVLLQDREQSVDLRNIRYVIVDELHAFVESERGVHLKCLLTKLDRLAKYPVQRIGLSATMGNPEEILHWFSEDRNASEQVAIPSGSKKKEFTFTVALGEEDQISALERIVSGRKALVFVNSRSEAENITKNAAGRIPNLHIHHSSLPLDLRRSAEESFHTGVSACIICTSTLELGVDIGDLDVVVQFGPPRTVSAFLQRMGRSGRRGKPAFVAWIAKDPCELLCSCAVIESAMQRGVEGLHPPDRPYHVLVQQLFLTLHSKARMSRRKLTHELISYPAFSGIPRNRVDEIIEHLIATRYLATDGEMLMPGTIAERILGRSNWQALYSVIIGGSEYRAVTPDGEVVGQLDARFVNSGAADLSLGGRSWSVVKCDEERRIVVVVPLESDSSRTFWSGGESGFSPLVCAAVQRIIVRGKTLLPLKPEKAAILNEILSRIPKGINCEEIAVFDHQGIRGHETLVYSFHGSRFNRVLASILADRLGKRAGVRYNDFLLRVRGLGQSNGADPVAAAIRECGRMSREEIGNRLPLPALETWKFAELLPDSCIFDMAVSNYYHVEEFRDIINRTNVVVLDGLGRTWAGPL